jgi:hypothetical protein
MPWKSLARKTWYMRRALAGMVSTARYGIAGSGTIYRDFLFVRIGLYSS